MLDYLKKLDAFPKAIDEVRVRTTSGAVVSILSIALMFVLFISELRYYRKTEVVDHLIVNTTRSSKLRVGFDISFPQIACRLLAVDAVDDSGMPLKDIEHELFKHKLAADGSKDQMTFAERHRLGGTVRETKDIEALSQEQATDVEKGCGNCYGAGIEHECCTTCEDVQRAYDRLGWRFRKQDIAQCLKEAFLETEEDKDAEDGGCQLYGHMVLDRASGHFHIAPHKVVHQGALQAGLFNLRDLLSFTFDQFNITHTINSLTFGEPYPGANYPLDGQRRQLQDTHAMHQYYIKVVPTSYTTLGRPTVESNQYSVTEHARHLSPASDRGLPGVYFYYEISPVSAAFEEKRTGSLGRFLTSVCAIVGGLFTVMGLVDKLASFALRLKGRMMP